MAREAARGFGRAHRLRRVRTGMEAADTAASGAHLEGSPPQQFWLRNRQPQNWRDKVVVEGGTPPETLSKSAERFIQIMAAARERQRQVLIERGVAEGPD